MLQYAADRERARQELVRSRQYFQALIEQTFVDLITVVDADGTILYQSPGIKRVLGLLPEEVLGRSLFSLVDEEQAARGRALLGAVLAGDENVPVGQFALRRRDGSIRYIDVVASRIAHDFNNVLIQEMLAAHGYDVLAACNPADALARAAAFPSPIDLLLTDVVMPGGNGRDLAGRLTASRPATKVLYMSGYPEYGAHVDLIGERRCRSSSSPSRGTCCCSGFASCSRSRR